MILSKRSNGVYYVIYEQTNGKRTRISTKKKNKAEALVFLSNFKNEVVLRNSKKSSSISFSDYANRFIELKKTFTTPKTIKAYQQSITCFKKFIGDINIGEITFQCINEYFQKRNNESSIYQTRKDHICLSSLFNAAIDEEIIEMNPLKKVKTFKLPEKLPTYFKEEEIEKLYEKIDNADIKDVVCFAHNTGLRQMEILSLRWSEIDIRDKHLILTNREFVTKSKKIRNIPLTSNALEILNRRRLNASGEKFVFTYKGKAIQQDFISHKFKEYVKAAELNDKLNFHSLRHTFASWLVQRGVPIYEVKELLGHSKISTTEIYAHLRREDLRSAVEKLEKF